MKLRCLRWCGYTDVASAPHLDTGAPCFIVFRTSSLRSTSHAKTVSLRSLTVFKNDLTTF